MEEDVERSSARLLRTRNVCQSQSESVVNVIVMYYGLVHLEMNQIAISSSKS